MTINHRYEYFLFVRWESVGFVWHVPNQDIFERLHKIPCVVVASNIYVGAVNLLMEGERMADAGFDGRMIVFPHLQSSFCLSLGALKNGR